MAVWTVTAKKHILLHGLRMEKLSSIHQTRHSEAVMCVMQYMATSHVARPRLVCCSKACTSKVRVHMHEFTCVWLNLYYTEVTPCHHVTCTAISPRSCVNYHKLRHCERNSGISRELKHCALIAGTVTNYAHYTSLFTEGQTLACSLSSTCPDHESWQHPQRLLHPQRPWPQLQTLHTTAKNHKAQNNKCLFPCHSVKCLLVSL